MKTKPELPHASVVKITKFRGKRPSNITPAAWDALCAGMADGVEPGTGDLGIGAHFTICGQDSNSDYLATKTDGTHSQISLFRLVRGCNHLDAFGLPGTEKSEDYDSLPANSILDLPNEYEEALPIILNDYVGKTLRVVARTAKGVELFDKRFYLFVIEN